MVSLYKYPSFSALISLLLVVDPPAKAAIDEIGSRISNKKIKVKKNDTAKSLASRILKQEHVLYPKALGKLFFNR